jgi:dTDP-4-dehydrorhamnose 3,5-epimerase
VKVEPASLPEVLVIEPRVFSDPRGHFFESYNRREFARATGIDVEFVQDNQSRSGRNVLRGLHYQVRQPQGKLVRVSVGEIWDVAVDLRRGSSTYGRWTGVALSAALPRLLWVPAGFAHGFLVLSERAEVQYKTTDYYAPEHERTLLWNDPALGIPWPQVGEPVMAEKDRRGKLLSDAEACD